MKTPLIRLTLVLLAGCSHPTPSNTTEASLTANTETPLPIPAESTGGVASSTTVPPAPADQGDDGLAALAGSWEVKAVHVRPGDVQALSANDPADMGAILNISRDRLAWQPHDGGTFADVCTKPRLTLDGQVSCATGQFGPPGIRLVPQDDGLRLDWYDDATLILQRHR
ncbi:MAG: hypothetical protein EON55_01930 [Alphaproteobacteria bacterium]|nr:MAG: hypothetical protein EON55_01930 [Alphaproteobacteria bacterium]